VRFDCRPLAPEVQTFSLYPGEPITCRNFRSVDEGAASPAKDFV
jgi:hypothetical protein